MPQKEKKKRNPQTPDLGFTCLILGAFSYVACLIYWLSSNEWLLAK
jgi:hypothetical protein